MTLGKAHHGDKPPSRGPAVPLTQPPAFDDGSVPGYDGDVGGLGPSNPDIEPGQAVGQRFAMPPTQLLAVGG